ncbi:hypothetical protein [Zoogloea sp.]|uniref:hypothetical protein n=1 Tax=Zoogloea sp. TaxID=49181 RepID=UPI0031FCCE51
MFIKACAISVALSCLGISVFDRKPEAGSDCKGSDPQCPPVHAVATGSNHMYAALMAR